MKELNENPKVLPSCTDDASSTHLFIELDKTSYSSGSVVTGVVVLVVQDELLPATQVQLHWEGKEFTNWYQGVNMTNNCTDERLIFSHKMCLWSNQDEKLHALVKGTYTWPFRWQLPVSIPGSFVEKVDENFFHLPWVLPKGGVIPKSLYGERSAISFSASATVELYDSSQVQSKPSTIPIRRDSRTGNLEVLPGKSLPTKSVNFRVTQAFDPELLKFKEITKKAEKKIPFNKMPLKIEATLPTGGICFKGYQLPIRIEVLNGTKKRVNSVGITILETITYNAQTENFQKIGVVFVGILKDVIIEGHGHFLQTVYMNIPNTLEPSITLGTLIQRHYELSIELRFTTISLGNLSLTFPINILEPTQNDSIYLKNFLPNNFTLDMVSQESTRHQSSSCCSNSNNDGSANKKDEENSYSIHDSTGEGIVGDPNDKKQSPNSSKEESMTTDEEVSTES